MKLQEFIAKAKSTPDQLSFADTIQTIDDRYTFLPTAFQNGALKNEKGENNGSCKIFAFAQMHDLTKEQTLHCFGTYYREDVLKDPNGDGHQNIRNFMNFGWEGIQLEGTALELS